MVGLSLSITAGVYEAAMLAALQAAALAGVVLLLTLALGRWIAPRYRYLMWLLVAVRLLLPFAPASPFSLQRLWPATPSAAVRDVLQPPDTATTSATRSVAVSSHEFWFVPTGEEAVPTSIASWKPTWPQLAYSLLFFVWSVGALAVAAWTAVASWRFGRRLRRCIPTVDERLTTLLSECRERMGVRRRVRLLIVPALSGPAQMGVFRARILLPDDVASTFSDDELRHIFLHELAHVRRRDVAVNWLLAVLRIFHWCNPVYWLVQSRLADERELACDAAAVDCLERDRPGGYGHTLVRMAARISGNDGGRFATAFAAPGLVTFWGRKASLRRRVRALRRLSARETRTWQSLAVLLLITVALIGLTDAGEPRIAVSDKVVDTSFDVPSDTTWTVGQSLPPDDSPRATRTYAVEPLLERIAKDSAGSKHQARQELLGLLSIAGGVGLSPQRQLAGASQTGAVEQSEDNTTAPNLEFLDGQLVATGTPSRLAEYAQLLNVWSTHGLSQITVEMRLITAPHDTRLISDFARGQIIAPGANDIGSLPSTAPRQEDVLALESSVAGSASVVSRQRVMLYVQKLDESEKRRLIDLAQGDRRTNVLQAPKVTLFNGQRATIQDQSGRPFVVGLQSVAKDVFQPHIEVIPEGNTFHVRAIAQPDTDSIQLDCRFIQSRITSVETSTVSTGDSNTGVTVQVPHVEECRYAVSANLGPDESLLVAPLKLDEDGRLFYLLIKPRVITD